MNNSTSCKQTLMWHVTSMFQPICMLFFLGWAMNGRQRTSVKLGLITVRHIWKQQPKKKMIWPSLIKYSNVFSVFCRHANKLSFRKMSNGMLKLHLITPVDSMEMPNITTLKLSNPITTRHHIQKKRKKNWNCNTAHCRSSVCVVNVCSFYGYNDTQNPFISPGIYQYKNCIKYHMILKTNARICGTHFHKSITVDFVASEMNWFDFKHEQCGSSCIFWYDDVRCKHNLKKPPARSCEICQCITEK